MRGMISFFESGGHLAITPDGPQGPRHVVQKGVVELARLTSAPILPVAYGASRKKVFNSWDHFLLLPFCKVVYIWGEPIFIPRSQPKRSWRKNASWSRSACAKSRPKPMDISRTPRALAAPSLSAQLPFEAGNPPDGMVPATQKWRL